MYLLRLFALASQFSLLRLRLKFGNLFGEEPLGFADLHVVTFAVNPGPSTYKRLKGFTQTMTANASCIDPYLIASVSRKCKMRRHLSDRITIQASATC